MGGGDEALFYPSDDFLLKSPRKHYRVPVRSQHWQLRSLISAERKNTIYFPGGAKSTHILRLNTETQEYETVRALSFSPRCLVAQNGWVCCGGETGEFTAVRLDSPDSSADSNQASASNDVDMGLDLSPDTRLPIEFESTGVESPTLSMMARVVQRSNKVVIAKSMKLARDRVNCITLWFPPEGPKHPGAYDEPVAVLANNDRTVTIVSLQDFESNEKSDPIDVIAYPDYVNRAVISPDGRLLIAILDDPFLYIRERVEKSGRGRGPFRSRDSVEWEWTYRDQYLLKSQQRGDNSESRGSFAACFSKSGGYLAVGTQYGTISVFDTAGFTDPTKPAFLTSFKSSRFGTGPGAIRDMAFCPGPYDLLAWTEDRGHVGIADVRSQFVYRQIVDIGAKDDFETFSTLDRNSVDPRLLEARQERDALAASLSSVLNIASRRNQRLGGSANDTRHDSPLTQDETAVLEALQDENRRRRSARAAARDSSSLASRYLDQLRNGTSGSRATPWSERPVRRSAQASDADATSARARDRELERSTSLTRQAVHDFMGTIREQRERVQAQSRLIQSQRDRTAEDQRQDEQPTSLDDIQQQLLTDLSQLNQPNRDRARIFGARNIQGSSQATSSSRSAERNADGLLGTTTIPTLREIREQNERNAAQAGDLDALYDLAIENLYDASRNDGETTRPRDRALYVAWARDDDAALRRNASDLGASDLGVHQVPPQPDNTSGLSWSQDGQILYVGAQNGIYELHLNTVRRKFSPHISFR